MQSNHKPLSRAKTAFFKEKVVDATSLSAIDCLAITEHYKNKHNIDVIVNGITAYGKPIIAAKQQQLREAAQERLDIFSGEIKYFKLLFSSAIDIEDPVYKELQEKLVEYFEKINFQNTDSFDSLSLEQKKEIHKLCEQSNVKELLDKKLQAEVAKVSAEIDHEVLDISLNMEETKKEIELIQQSLKTDEYAGYMYTGGHSIGAPHFEVLILSKDSVIKPIYGMAERLDPESFKSYYYSGLNRLIADGPIPRHEIKLAQSDGSSCGTIGMLYLKELLKNNAQQLNYLSLQFAYLTPTGKINYYFIPSPQVLRYSQSSSYNEVIKELLLSDAPTIDIIAKVDPNFFVKNKETRSYTLHTFKSMIIHTREQATQMRNSQLVAECDLLLNRLPQFRKEWLEEYEKVVRYRSQMDKKGGNELQNVYLAYATYRMQSLASQGSPQEATKNLSTQSGEEVSTSSMSLKNKP